MTRSYWSTVQCQREMNAWLVETIDSKSERGKTHGMMRRTMSRTHPASGFFHHHYHQLRYFFFFFFFFSFSLSLSLPPCSISIGKNDLLCTHTRLLTLICLCRCRFILLLFSFSKNLALTRVPPLFPTTAAAVVVVHLSLRWKWNYTYWYPCAKNKRERETVLCRVCVFFFVLALYPSGIVLLDVFPEIFLQSGRRNGKWKLNRIVQVATKKFAQLFTDRWLAQDRCMTFKENWTILRIDQFIEQRSWYATRQNGIDWRATSSFIAGKRHPLQNIKIISFEEF